jgi:ATP-binding cassette, subfamily B, bacterial MsbA
MKTYLKLLKFAPQIRGLMLPFGFFMILHVVFSQLNFVMIMPLLDILFGTTNEDVLLASEVPELSLNLQSLTLNFQYFLSSLVQSQGSFEALKIICIIVVSAAFISNLSKHLSDRILESIRSTFIHNLRQKVFEHLVSLHLGFFEKKKKGDIISRMTSDMQEVEATVIHALTVLIRDPVMLIGFFFILFSISVELTLYSLIIIPAIGGLIGALIKKLKKDAERTQKSLGQLVTYLEEAVSGLRVIKAFNAEKFIKSTFNRENTFYASSVRKLNVRRQLTPPLSEFMGIVLVAIILLVGGALVLNQESSLRASGFIAYLAVFSQVIRPAKSLSETFSNVQRSLVAGTRILEIKEIQNPITDKENSVELKEFKEAIRFENISFAYEDKAVLENIDLEIPRGKMIALVGPSGSGKTTISDLIPRFYEPFSGRISIDGVDIKNCKIESLRSLMGIVTQEPILFHDTIFNNIAFGKTRSREEIEKAAKIANAHEFILNTENGYDTMVGDRGMKLSGGQRQRISIARAILANPPILILDEATSSLDTESEKLVQEALDKLMQNRTSLVIAHRLSTIQKADNIIVLDAGKVVETGTHEGLLKNGDGLYSRLSKMQGIRP